ncbi:hypothetical protein [Ottowia oryzae]
MNPPSPEVRPPPAKPARASVRPTSRWAAAWAALARVWRRMPRSWLAALAVVLLGLVSMGALGGLLYFAVAPAVWPLFGNLNDWRGDGVWPATVAVGMLWSLGFVLAGWLNQRWLARGWSPRRRRLAYAVVLWLGAALLWVLVAATSDIRFS